MSYAYIHRRERKGDFRRLWVLRIGAAARSLGLNYNSFIYGLKQAGSDLNRKVLADIAVRDPELTEELLFIRKSSGAVPGPMDCWLTLRGIKTLHVRMRQHNANGLAIARYLENHPDVDKVYYPGLESHPQYALAVEQMNGFTGMVSVDVGTLERAKALTEQLSIFSLAESLGGVESLISVPALMTHASVPEDRRSAMGINPGFVRLSVGIEEEADLINDLEGVLG